MRKTEIRQINPKEQTINDKIRQMNPREQLINHIEKERSVLNRLLAGGAKVEEIYSQSLVVDRLIEQFLVS